MILFCQLLTPSSQHSSAPFVADPADEVGVTPVVVGNQLEDAILPTSDPFSKQSASDPEHNTSNKLRGPYAMESMPFPLYLDPGTYRKGLFCLVSRSRPSDCSLETGSGGSGQGARGGDLYSHNTTNSVIVNVDVSDLFYNNCMSKTHERLGWDMDWARNGAPASRKECRCVSSSQISCW